MKPSFLGPSGRTNSRFRWFFCSADSGHSYLLADGINSENNAVYIWQHATDPFGTGNNSKGIIKLADSLTDFFLTLTRLENLEKE